MKSLKTLWKILAIDLAKMCSTSASLDYNTVECRIEHEGLSFLTITLPSFGKDFERCLEKGLVDHRDFLGFKRGRQGPLPLFLGGFLDQVFDTRTGCLLDVPSIDCIFAVRQLTLVYSKILIPCSDAREKGAIDGYLQTEREVEEWNRSNHADDLLDFRRVSTLLFGNVLSSMDRKIQRGELLPKHGPGATADKLRGNAKFDLSEWPERLERALPYGEYALPSWRYYYQLDRVNFPEPETERPVKVITVPKTLKTPRIIAVEPTCMQYMQQALLEPLVQLLESDSTPSGPNHSFGMIGFSDQNPNRDLAKLGSSTGRLATIDLSEASDRVSTLHVDALLGRWPNFHEATFATRSLKAEVPGKGVYTLSKFASMGSALCFPMEAMTFLSVVFLGIQDALDRPVTLRDIKSLRGQVRVYGDDIVVPVDYVLPVMRRLESFGFRVNANKSFWNGKFRESCGGDYYDGELVTPVRCRRMFPQSRADVPEVISLVELRNLLYYRGLWKTCEYLDQVIGKVLPHYPIAESSSPVLGRSSFLPYKAEKMHDELHKPLVKGYVPRSKPPASTVSGEGALLKFFLKRGREPFADERHLERQGRPDAVTLKLRWMTPY